MVIEHDKVCQFEKPRYGVVRLCEGRSIMLTPRCSVQIIADDAERIFGAVSRAGDEFVKINWNNALVTLYRSGSMMFYEISERELAERYATEILTKLGLITNCCTGAEK